MPEEDNIFGIDYFTVSSLGGRKPPKFDTMKGRLTVEAAIGPTRGWLSSRTPSPDNGWNPPAYRYG